MQGKKLGNHHDVGRALLLGEKNLTINQCWAGHCGSKKKKSNFQKSTKFNWQGIASRIKKLKL